MVLAIISAVVTPIMAGGTIYGLAADNDQSIEDTTDVRKTIPLVIPEFMWKTIAIT